MINKHSIIVAFFTLVTGCAINVTEMHSIVSHKQSATNVQKLSIPENINNYDISISGIPTDSIYAQLSIRQIIRNDQEPRSATISFNPAGDLLVATNLNSWETMIIDNLTMQAKRSLPLSIYNASGDIVVDQMDSTITIRSTSGDVTISNGRSDIFATLTSGDLKARTTGFIEASITSGESELTTIKGCKLSSTSGDCSVTLPFSSSGLKTSSITISVVSGDIILNIPKNTGLSINAKVTSGSIKIDGISNNGTLFIGPLNGGGIPVTLNTTSGDIFVRVY